jgi:hypothetical protein
VSCAWGCKLARRLETKRLRVHLEPEEGQELQDEAPSGNVSTNWYGASNRDLASALRFLAELRQDVEANGWINAEQWKGQVTRILGQGYYDLLTAWIPMDATAIQAAIQLPAHARNFNMPLPPNLATDGALADPKLSWQMGINLIDLARLQMEDLARIRKMGDGRDQQDGASALDVAVRYVTTASRDLERAVKWFLHLKTEGL